MAEPRLIRIILAFMAALLGGPLSLAWSQPPSSSDYHAKKNPVIELTAPYLDMKGHWEVTPAGVYHVRGGIVFSYRNTVMSADRMDGSYQDGFVFTGHAHIARPGVEAEADAIHFYPAEDSYRLDNPRSVLSPSLFNGKLTSPLFVDGGEIQGDSQGDTEGRNLVSTTCIERKPHYKLTISSAALIPNKKLTLRNVSLFLFGVKLFTVPRMVIPLKQRRFPRRPRPNYLPEFGQNIDEGYFARFPYAFSEGEDAGGLVRLDITQKRGPGYRIEQEYLAGKQPPQYSSNQSGASTGNGVILSAYGYGSSGAKLPRLGTGIGPADGGLFSMQGYFSQGFTGNFSASLKHQQDIGGSNRIALDTELQDTAFNLGGGGSTSNQALTGRFDFAHNDTVHGVSGDFNISMNSNFSSSGFSSRQLTANLTQNFLFGPPGRSANSLNYSLGFSRFLSEGAGFLSLSKLLNGDIKYQRTASDYLLTLEAAGSIPLGGQTGNGSFGTLQKLPELTISGDTYRFKGGWLHNLPIMFQIGAGDYSEPGSGVTSGRYLLGLTTQPISVMRGRTEMTTALGFQQNLYGDGAAQYLLQDHTRLRQHLGGRSGIDLDYDYQQPEGATPFLFDQLRRAHTLALEAGYLDDRHFQLTARVGYDLSGFSSSTPWQSLSTRVMWRPNSFFRFDSTQVYDPNRGRLFAITNMFRFRGPRHFSLDLLTNIDPQQTGLLHKFTQINSQFFFPISQNWRLSGLLNYSGLTKQFQTVNLQLVHEWDCLEASLTYTNSLGGYRPERSILLAIRIKGFPAYHAQNIGPAGQSLGTGIGTIY